MLKIGLGNVLNTVCAFININIITQRNVSLMQPIAREYVD